MAAPKGGVEAKKKGKKPHKNKPSGKKYKHYEVSGTGMKRKKKMCPRCGAGTFLASHKGRLYCGKCKYTEFVSG